MSIRNVGIFLTFEYGSLSRSYYNENPWEEGWIIYMYKAKVKLSLSLFFN
jgi:hypothetical protein